MKNSEPERGRLTFSSYVGCSLSFAEIKAFHRNRIGGIMEFRDYWGGYYSVSFKAETDSVRFIGKWTCSEKGTGPWSDKGKCWLCFPFTDLKAKRMYIQGHWTEDGEPMMVSGWLNMKATD